MSSSTLRRLRHVVAATVLAGFGLSACVPETPGPPTVGAAIVVSDTTDLRPGDVVTVSGTGFTPTGNLGTRPPLLGAPAGVYVTFGRFAETWQPSAGAGGRTVLVQKWALPESSRQTLIGFPWLQDPASFVTIGEDGSWSAELVVPAVDPAATDYGIAVFGGSGSVNTGEELLQRVTVASAVNVGAA